MGGLLSYPFCLLLQNYFVLLDVDFALKSRRIRLLKKRYHNCYDYRTDSTESP